MAKAFIAACAQYFGRLPGQSLGEFKAECDKLTEKDRDELIPMLAAAIGDEVLRPAPPA